MYRQNWQERIVTVVSLDWMNGSGKTTELEGYRGARFIRAQLQARAETNTEGSYLQVFIEDTLDSGANWNPVGEFPRIISDGERMDEVRIINVTQPFTDTLRVRWEIALPDNAPPDSVPPTFNFGVSWYVE